MSTRSGLKLIAWVLITLAFAAAFGYTISETVHAQRLAAGIFGLFLGAALLLWGIEELGQGSIRGRRVQVRRSDSPVVFLLLLLGKRIAPGILMIGAALWMVFFRTA